MCTMVNCTWEVTLNFVSQILLLNELCVLFAFAFDFKLMMMAGRPVSFRAACKLRGGGSGGGASSSTGSSNSSRV